MENIGKMYRISIGGVGVILGKFMPPINMSNIRALTKGTIFTLISLHEKEQCGYGKQGFITILVGDKFYWTNREVLDTSAREIRTRKKC
jgi:hypothetical protein